MLIHTCWAWRKHEDGPELLEAWDEYTVEQNYEGWQAACQKAIASLGNDISSLGVRYIDLRVDGDAVEEAFSSNEIEGKVVQ